MTRSTTHGTTSPCHLPRSPARTQILALHKTPLFPRADYTPSPRTIVGSEVSLQRVA